MDQDVSKTSNASSLNSNTAIKFVGISSGASTITLGLNGLSGTATDTILSYTTNTDETISISSGIVRTTKLVVKTSEINAQEWQTLSGNIVASINNSGYFAGFLASGVVNSESVLSGSIGTNQLASGVLQSVPANIQSGQITSGYLGNSSVNNININSGTIANDKLANNTITIAGSSTALGASWAAAALTTSSGLLAGTFYPSGALTIGIASGGVASQMISDNAIISGKVASGSLTTNAFASGTTFGTNITSGYITSGYLGNNSVISGSVGSGQIGIYHLASGTISTALLGSGQIVSGNIASGQIGANHLASGVMFTLNSGSVNSGNIANEAVVSGSIASGTISQQHTNTYFELPKKGVGSSGFFSYALGEGTYASGTSSICIGALAGVGVYNTSFGNNFIGFGAGYSSGNAQYKQFNVGVGNWAATNNGYSCTAIGSQAQYKSGNYSIAIGAEVNQANESYFSGRTTALTQIGLNISNARTLIYGLANFPHGINVTNTLGVLKAYMSSGGEIFGTLASGLVVSGSVASGQIGINHLASGVLASPTILSGTIVSGLIGNNAVNSGNVSSGSIDSMHIADGAVASGDIAANSIGSPHILSGSILNNSLANPTVTIAGSSTALGASWAAAALTTSSGLLAGTFYPSGALTIGIASGGITSQLLADGSVASGEIASGQIGTNHLASGTISTATLGSGQVVSGNIASGQIGVSHLASGVLASPVILSGTIISGMLGNNSINSGNIASGSVGQFHHSSGSVASGHIGNFAVVNTSISSGTIANDKLANSTVTIAGSSTALGASWAAQALTTASGLLAGTFYPSGALTIGIASGGLLPQMFGSGSILSGSVASGQIGPDHLSSGALGIAGTSGMLQFNNGGVFGATSGLNYSMTSGNNFVHMQAQTAFNTTLAVKAASGQITNLQSWTNTSGSALAYMDASGNFFAVSKSFLINHPNKPGKKLRHVSLEGPSADVYFRGKSSSNTFTLPDYWKNLVDENNIDIILIPIGSKQSLYVEKIENLIVHVGGCEKPYYTFLAIAERIDMSKIVVEE
jgi:hypothetical protein